MPAHLFVSADRGDSWTECTGLREVPTISQWCFPPPPRLGHVKDIVIADERLYVGIEIGALLVSEDGGKSFTDLRVDPDPAESDIHRVLIHPEEAGPHSGLQRPDGPDAQRRPRRDLGQGRDAGGHELSGRRS